MGVSVEYGTSPLIPYYMMVTTGDAIGQASFRQAMWQHLWDEMHEHMGYGGVGPYMGQGMNANMRTRMQQEMEEHMGGNFGGMMGVVELFPHSLLPLHRFRLGFQNPSRDFLSCLVGHYVVHVALNPGVECERPPERIFGFSGADRIS